MSYKLLIGGGVAIAYSLGLHLYSVKLGVDKTDVKWQTANVETLLEGNSHLQNVIKQKDGEFVLAHSQSIKAGDEIETRTNTIIREIKVPVETIVKVEVPVGCDATDINISYDTLRLFNSWSEGRRLNEEPNATTTRDVPLVGAGEMQRDTSRNGYK